MNPHNWAMLGPCKEGSCGSCHGEVNRVVDGALKLYTCACDCHAGERIETGPDYEEGE